MAQFGDCFATPFLIRCREHRLGAESLICTEPRPSPNLEASYGFLQHVWRTDR